MSTITAQIQLRRDTSANWTSNNPILAAGEVAFTSDVFYTSTDQQRFKIGDGVQTWTQLDYVPEGGGVGYSLSIPAGHITNLSPPDANTFYYGNGKNSSIYSPDAAIVIANAGTIKKIGIISIVNGTLGTTENSTFSLRKRTGTAGTPTDTVITSSYKFNTVYYTAMYTGFNISVAEGDLVEIKWDTPTWVTNPTAIQFNVTLFIV